MSTPDRSAAYVPREQYERVVAALGEAVEALDIATDALAAGDSEDPGNDEGRYSDRATLRGDLRWCLASVVSDDGDESAVLFRERKRAA